MTVLIEVVKVTAPRSKHDQRVREYAASHVDMGDGPLCGFHREDMVLVPSFDVTCDKCRSRLRKHLSKEAA